MFAQVISTGFGFYAAECCSKKILVSCQGGTDVFPLILTDILNIGNKLYFLSLIKLNLLKCITDKNQLLSFDCTFNIMLDKRRS